MALWPFRRKSSLKRPRSGALSDAEGPPPPRSQPDGAAAREAAKKKQRTEPAKLQRRPRTYSFSPGRNDSIRVDRPHGAPAAAAAAPPQLVWERMPTLHHRTHPLPARRRSSMRRREDHEREAEIKAMSAGAHARPAPDAPPPAGTLSKHDNSSKTARAPAASGQWDEPTSYPSLPRLASLYSNVASDSDRVSYKISVLDSLAPRPTLRYANGARWTPSRASEPARTASQGKTLAARGAVADEALDARKRIDDLADGLDASDLRELMERDNRRRERRRQREQERVERRLARRADKHRRDEAEARQSGTTPPENLERGVLGRELVGLGIDPPSAVVTSSRRREPLGPDAAHTSTPSKAPLDSFHPAGTAKAPLDSFRPAVTPARAEPEAAAADETAAALPVVPTVHTEPPPEPEAPEAPPPATVLPHSSLLGSLLRSRKSQSKSTLSSDKDNRATGDDELARKDSESSLRPARLSISSMLRWGGRHRRNSGPSSFSNTSREEMAQAQADALAKLQADDAAQGGLPPPGKAGTAPRRTRSRFREDLPDFPISPPDSRVQSPESEPPLPMVAEAKTPETPEAERHASASSQSPTPASAPRPVDAPRGLHSPADRMYAVDAHQSISLASIDSEGSWLSGRVGSKRSAYLRDSIARASRRDEVPPGPPSAGSSTHEDKTLLDDEYLARLAPRRSSIANATTGRPSGEGRPSSDEDEPTHLEGDVRWGVVAGARPHVVYHRPDRDTMRSREGLLNIDSGDEDSEAPASPVSIEGPADVRRARSVNVGRGRVRNFSAGSVRLLDMSAASSPGEMRRRSGPLHL